MNELNKRRLIHKVSYLVLFIAICYGVYYTTRRQRIKRSEYRYCVGKITGNYYSGNTYGKEVIYHYNNTLYVNHCASQFCKNLNIGERYIIKIYLEDPYVFDVLNLKVYDTSLVAPVNGWKTIPLLKY